MNFTSGTRLGPYEIIGPLGAGGMGEVYRAKDTNLNRDVALKILPASFSADADRVARFKREAQVLASLNHPNIAQIYGIEANAIVMELVEGEDLSVQIARGPLALSDAEPIARQIADALEVAHEQGIVHRDLKPQNIKVRADGTVKVLDFGLAKAMDPAAASGANVANSPTMTANATAMGMIIGTAPYMSPEQARGRSVDKRSDIWAFGAVLYEMLSGRRAFEGEDISITLANVIKDHPQWDALPANLPEPVARLLRRCLEKDPRKRLRDIGEARLILEDPSALNARSSVLGAPASPSRRPRAGWIAAGTFAAGLVVAVLLWSPWQSAPLAVSSLAIELPTTEEGPDSLELSPDGARIVFKTRGRLMLRSLSSFDTSLIDGVDSVDLRYPVFSPNGDAIAFALDKTIKRIPVSGGVPVDLAELSAVPNSLVWEGKTILAGLGAGGIVRIADTGSSPETVIAMAAGEQAAAPRLLPGGDAIMFTLARGVPEADWNASSIVVQTLSSGRRDVIVKAGTDARYLPTGHIVYGVSGVWFAAPYDLRARTTTGAPVPVLPGVSRVMTRGLRQPKGKLAVAANGTLAYVSGAAAVSLDRRILFTTRAGVTREVDWPAKPYEAPRVSPDGKSLALSTSDDKEAAVLVYDLSGTSAPRSLTLTGRNRFPVWSPDSRRLAFQSQRAGASGIFVQRADGSGEPEQWTTTEAGTTQVPESWSRDERYLSFSVVRGSQSELWLYSIADRRSARFSDVVSVSSLNSTFSPDSQWLAYTLRGTVGGELFIHSVGHPTERYKISTTLPGQHHSVWSPSGKELFFFSGDGFWSIPVSLGRTVSWGTHTRVAGRVPNTHTQLSARNYDVTPNGDAFVSTKIPDGDLAQNAGGLSVRIVLNWFSRLKAEMAAK